MRPVLARLAGRVSARPARALMPTVAELVVEGLRHAGVARIFGVPGGGSNLELIEAARVPGAALRALPPGMGGVHHGRGHRRADGPTGRGALDARGRA